MDSCIAEKGIFVLDSVCSNIARILQLEHAIVQSNNASPFADESVLECSQLEHVAVTSANASQFTAKRVWECTQLEHIAATLAIKSGTRVSKIAMLLAEAQANVAAVGLVHSDIKSACGVCPKLRRS